MQTHLRLLNHFRHTVLPIAAVMGLACVPCVALAQPTQIIIDDTRVFPESLTSTADGTVIIGSLDHGTVYRAAAGAAKATPWIAPGSDGLTRVFGVLAHDATNTLWVCTDDPDQQRGRAELKAFDLKTAAPKAGYAFPGGGLCNDIAVARDGTTYATDTRGGRILVLKRGATALDVLWADTKWIGIDGIALMTNGSLLFNNVRENQLVRVDIKPGGAAGTVTQLGLSQPIDGPDGMRALPDGRFILAESRAGKIDIVTIEGEKAKIETIKDGFKFTPTAVTVVGETAWALEAKFAYRNDPALKDKDPGQFGATAVPMPKE
jgi:sugar lactone lactonase YvrE